MSKKVTKLGSGYYFNCFAMKTIIALLKKKVIEENNVHLEYYKPKHKSFLFICNHTEAADPGYEMAAMRKYIRYIASDHTLRMSLGWAFKLFGGVIIKYRDKPSDALMDDIKANLKKNKTPRDTTSVKTSQNRSTPFFSPLGYFSFKFEINTALMYEINVVNKISHIKVTFHDM